MINLQIFLYGLYGFFCNFWFVFIYVVAALIFLWRWEKSEQKRMEEAIKRDNLKGRYHQKYFTSRN